jgi:hypothetical protein
MYVAPRFLFPAKKDFGDETRGRGWIESGVVRRPRDNNGDDGANVRSTAIDDAILANLSCGLLRRMFRIFWVLRRNAIDALLSVEVQSSASSAPGDTLQQRRQRRRKQIIHTYHNGAMTTRATDDEGVSFAIVFHNKTKEYHRDDATTMLLSDYHLLLCGFDVADGCDMVGAYDHRVLYV